MRYSSTLMGMGMRYSLMSMVDPGGGAGEAAGEGGIRGEDGRRVKREEMERRGVMGTGQERPERVGWGAGEVSYVRLVRSPAEAHMDGFCGGREANKNEYLQL